MSEAISITGLDKAAVLAALYNASKQRGMGFLHSSGAKPMTVEEARTTLDEQGTNFDYLHGRVMKVEIKGDSLKPWGYDRDNGEGAAAHALSPLLTA